MRFESTLNSICDSVGIQDAPKTLKVKPLDRMVTTILFTTVIFMGGFIPLYGGPGIVQTARGIAFYTVEGSWMSVGLQPFITVSMIQDLVWKDMPRRFSRLAGLAWCVANAMIYGYQNSSWAVFLQLAAISGACVHALQYNDHKGLLSLHSSTLFMNAATNFVYGIPNLWGTSVSIVLAFAMLWLDTLHVPFNLSAFRGRSAYSQGLPLMIHGTTPLIIVYSAIETLMKVSRGYVDLRPNDFVRATVFLLGVYGMATQYAGVSSNTGYHIVKQWEKQKVALKGWRSGKMMGRFVNRTVEDNARWNGIVLCALWVISTTLKPTVSGTTLLLMMGIVTRESKQIERILME